MNEQENPADPVIQTPDNPGVPETAPSYVQTAREWYKSGSPLPECVRWLLAQNDPDYSTEETARAAILA